MDEKFVTSTGDDRTVNNAMRHQYRVLSDEEKADMQKVKDDGLAFFELMTAIGMKRPGGNTPGTSRELSLAKTKIEEAVMWAIKHITG